MAIALRAGSIEFHLKECSAERSKPNVAFGHSQQILARWLDPTMKDWAAVKAKVMVCLVVKQNWKAAAWLPQSKAKAFPFGGSEQNFGVRQPCCRFDAIVLGCGSMAAAFSRQVPTHLSWPVATTKPTMFYKDACILAKLIRRKNLCRVRGLAWKRRRFEATQHRAAVLQYRQLIVDVLAQGHKVLPDLR